MAQPYNGPSPATTPTNPQTYTDYLTKLSHILYSQSHAIAAPNTPLSSAITLCMSSMDLSAQTSYATLLSYLHVLIKSLKDFRGKQNVARFRFSENNLAVCANVAMLLAKVEKDRVEPQWKHGQDMRERMVYRLGQVKLVRRWDGEQKVSVWVLEWTEEGLPAFGEKDVGGKGGSEDGESMDVDG